MEANPLFPEIVESYKNHIRISGMDHLSFSFYCRGYGVRFQSVGQWMRRHGLSVSRLRYEVLFEGGGTDGPVVPSLFTGRERRHLEVVGGKRPGPELVLKGANVAFPDGVIVDIRQASAPALAKFIDSYNKIIDKNHVQPE